MKTEFSFWVKFLFKLICGVFSLSFLGQQREKCKTEERVKGAQDMKRPDPTNYPQHRCFNNIAQFFCFFIHLFILNCWYVLCSPSAIISSLKKGNCVIFFSLSCHFRPNMKLTRNELNFFFGTQKFSKVVQQNGAAEC